MYKLFCIYFIISLFSGLHPVKFYEINLLKQKHNLFETENFYGVTEIYLSAHTETFLKRKIFLVADYFVFTEVLLYF